MSEKFRELGRTRRHPEYAAWRGKRAWEGGGAHTPLPQRGKMGTFQELLHHKVVSKMGGWRLFIETQKCMFYIYINPNYKYIFAFFQLSKAK